MKDQDKTKEQLAMLNRMGQEFTATLDLQQVTEQLLPAVAGIIGAEGASVWLWDGAPEGWLICRTAYQHGQTRSPVNLRLRPGQGVAGWVAQKKEIAVVRNVQHDPRFFSGVDEQTGFHTLSLLAAPLWMHGRVIGVLEVVNKLNGDFDEDDRILVETIAASAAIAIDNARLVETLRQRTVDLQTYRGRLDALTRTLSDDLRGPLGLVVSSARTLEDDYTALSDEERLRHLRTIVRKGHKMIEVIDGLLAAQTEPLKEIEEEIGPLDTGSIVTGALERLAYMIQRYKAEIILPASWPVALGHSPWIEEVWINYISNGIEHGGRPPRVELGSTEQGDGTIRFWVRDNGPGLPPEEQVQLFVPSARRDRARDTEYGMGLAIVRRIVEKLGGQVGVESEVGQGNLFYFTLPVAG